MWFFVKWRWWWILSQLIFNCYMKTIIINWDLWSRWLPLQSTGFPRARPQLPKRKSLFGDLRTRAVPAGVRRLPFQSAWIVKITHLNTLQCLLCGGGVCFLMHYFWICLSWFKLKVKHNSIFKICKTSITISNSIQYFNLIVDPFNSTIIIRIDKTIFNVWQMFPQCL